MEKGGTDSMHSMLAAELKVSSCGFLEWNPGHQGLSRSDVDFFCGVSPFLTQLEHRPGGQHKLLNDSVHCLRASW